MRIILEEIWWIFLMVDPISPHTIHQIPGRAWFWLLFWSQEHPQNAESEQATRVPEQWQSLGQQSLGQQLLHHHCFWSVPQWQVWLEGWPPNWHAQGTGSSLQHFSDLLCYQKESSLRENIQDWVWHYANKTVKTAVKSAMRAYATGSGLRLRQEDQELQTSLSSGKGKQITPPPLQVGSELHLSIRLYPAISWDTRSKPPKTECLKAARNRNYYFCFLPKDTCFGADKTKFVSNPGSEL